MRDRKRKIRFFFVFFLSLNFKYSLILEKKPEIVNEVRQIKRKTEGSSEREKGEKRQEQFLQKNHFFGKIEDHNFARKYIRAL